MDVSPVESPDVLTEKTDSFTTHSSHNYASLALQDGGPDCKCKANSEQTTPAAPQFVYALGSINPRFPNESVEKEYAQVLTRTDNAGLSDKATLKKLISAPEYRYLLRQLCWVMSVQGLDTYVLYPRDPLALDALVDAVRPVGTGEDVDLAIGNLGSLSKPEACGGLSLPVVVFDQIYSFDTTSLIGLIAKPSAMKDEAFNPLAHSLFNRIMQLADNAGATDDHRALNYLAVRYPAIYSEAAELAHQDYSLTQVQTIHSRLSSAGQKIVDVVITFVSRKTGVQEQRFVRVNVSGEFPFIVTPLQPYYSR